MRQTRTSGLLDRMAALIIALGIFVGSVQSLLQVAQTHAPATIGERSTFILASEKAGVGYEGEYEIVTAPTAEQAQDELVASGAALKVMTVLPEIEGAEGSPRSEERLEVISGINGCISTDADGMVATYPEAGKRVLYLGYSLAILRLKPGENIEDIHDFLVLINAVVVDEMAEKASIILPTEAEPRLASLVESHIIESYEIGGWGSTLGKA